MAKKRWIALTALFLLLMMTYTILLLWNIHRYANQQPEEEIDYLIVLGARVKGETPSLSLRYRIDAAASFLKDHPQTIAIVSGGQGKGELISEAAAMQKELIAQGIDEKRIILEDKSTNTYMNIKKSRDLIPSGLTNGGVVTNDYHLYRTIKIAKKQGLDLIGIPAKTPKAALVKSYTRELAAITKYLLTDQIDW